MTFAEMAPALGVTLAVAGVLSALAIHLARRRYLNDDDARTRLMQVRTSEDCYLILSRLSPDSMVTWQAQEKYNSLLRAEMATASTIEQLWAVIGNADTSHMGAQAAVEEGYSKILKLASSTQDVLDVFEEIPFDDPRNDSLIRRAIELAASEEDIDLVDEILDCDDDADLPLCILALRKRLTFIESIEDVAALMDEYEPGFELWAVIVRHAAQMVGPEESEPVSTPEAA